MRWRGYDLSAYSDEEVSVAADMLGGWVSPEGETSEDGRQALADLLLQRRLDPDAGAPHMPDIQEGDQAPPENPLHPQDSAPDEVSSAGVADDTTSSAASAPTTAGGLRKATGPIPPNERPHLGERFRHIFGVHTWHRVEGEDGPVLRCFGCRMERPTYMAPSPEPLRFPGEDDDETPADGGTGRPKAGPGMEHSQFGGQQSRREQGTPPGSDMDQEPGVAQVFRMFIRSPWWVKLLAVFVIAQVAGVVASLFGGSS